MKGTGLVKAIGLMSGTSLDGVDAAEVMTDGETIDAFGSSTYRSYSNEERAVLRGVLGRWPGNGLEQALAVVQDAHIEVLITSFFASESLGIRHTPLLSFLYFLLFYST